MDSEQAVTDKSDQTAPTRRPWSTPQLTVYGRMAAATRITSERSDRNTKTDFAPVNTRPILGSLAALPVETWCYRFEDPSVRHIGPMAQDFAAAFAVGGDNTRIHVVDAAGVAFAAIQGLHSLAQEQDAAICLLRRQLSDLEAELELLRASLRQDQRQRAGIPN